MAFDPITNRNRGRPKLFEARPDIGEELAGYIRRGLFLNAACAMAGCSITSVRKILLQGNNDLEDDLDTDEAKFTILLKTALAETELDALDKLTNAGNNPAFWASQAWKLERMFPDKYGRKDRVAMEHTGTMGIGVANVPTPIHDRLNDESKREAAKDIARSLAIIGSGRSSPERGADGPSDSGDELEGEATPTLGFPE